MIKNWKDVRVKQIAAKELSGKYSTLFPNIEGCFDYDGRLDFERNVGNIRANLLSEIGDGELVQKIMGDYFGIIRRLNDKKYGSESFSNDHIRERQNALGGDWNNSLRQLCEEIGFEYGGRVVVPGVNDGEEISGLPYKIIGGDISPTAIERATEKDSHNEFLVFSANELPFQDGIFDGYISLRTFSVSGVNMGEAMRESSRVLRPDGRILLSFPLTRSKRFPARDAEYALGLMKESYENIGCKRIGIEDMIYGTRK